MSAPLSKNKSPLVWVEINLNALRQNLRAIRKTLYGSSVEILAVVKADAYGHGMTRVAEALHKEGVCFFGVANIDEALELRKSLSKVRILVLGSFHPEHISDYIAYNITPTLSCAEDAITLNRGSKGRGMIAAHVKIDTGMGRLGLPHAETEIFFKKIKSLPGIRVEGIYTHFSSADEKAPTRTQLKIFSACLEKIRSMGFDPRYIHTSNSLGILGFKEAHFNLVRPGLILYGLKPSPKAKLPPGVAPILSWKAKISFLKKFSPGQTVSYGRTHQILKNTLIAALPVGYSHGYRVAFSGRSFVLIGGRRCRVAGRVTMDQTLVDVNAVSRVKRWQEAVLIGQQGNKTILAEELASLAQTIPYEIVCGIHSRVPRLYK